MASVRNDKTSANSPQPHSKQEIAALYDASGYDLDTHPAHMIRRAHQRATTCFQNAMTGYDLTPTQHAALATLLRHGELSQNHLGRITAMDRSTISIVVRKLMESGLVQSSPSSTDQRLSVLRLTPDGIEYTLPLLKLSLDSAEQFLAPLTSRERSAFVKLLAKLTDTE